ncbi:M81 family metallopeptidase [Phenylobacterium sp.]|uniref:M81 family metallopeptidase n=1 Tax=Phenylobacterium sp. TaxID=1871053 RepID=UPI0028A2AC64|nr:M81 family metallopeptidase [Phenylobacterium sp.]
MKFYCASIAHETSRWSPIPTNLDSYRRQLLYLPSAGEQHPLPPEAIDPAGWCGVLRARGHETVIGPFASAVPSRPTPRADYEVLKGELLAALRAALPVDGVALLLHGAQVAEGVDDCEGDMLAAVRAIVGPDVPIGVVFDLHGNVSDAMVASADVLLACLEYPHIDFDSRAVQMALLVERAARGEIRPTTVRQRVPMLGTYYTTVHPMRGLVDWAKAHEGQDGVLAVSITHGFAWADIADCGASVLVCSDQRRPEARALADRIADRYFSLRDQIRSPRLPAEQAVAAALAHPAGPVVIADTADNPGGGAAGDSTFLLRALLDLKASNAALGMLWDPVAASLAIKAGVGARLRLRIGGKTSPASGPPLDVDALVLACRTDATQNAQGAVSPLGPSALIQVEGVKVVLNSIRDQVFDPACFEAFGVDPRGCDIVVVKGQQHFHALFSPFMAAVLYATPPGTVDTDYETMTFKRIPSPMHPIVKPPFQAFGREWSV